MTIIGPLSPGATPPAAAPVNDSLGKDAFLKLLVAQLKYQDPLNPADGAEFMAQTAQMQMVEKLDELAKQNAELLSSQHTVAGSNLIGRSITYRDPDGVDATGTVDGVRLTIDGPFLRVGAHAVPLAAVKEVRPTT